MAHDVHTAVNQIRSSAVARKADRTAYDLRCRTLNNRTAEICMYGIAMVTKLSMVRSDGSGSEIQLFQICKFRRFVVHGMFLIYSPDGSRGREFEGWG